jgi:hypothetical protein
MTRILENVNFLEHVSKKAKLITRNHSKGKPETCFDSKGTLTEQTIEHVNMSLFSILKKENLKKVPKR